MESRVAPAQDATRLLIGESDFAIELRALVARIATADANVLITGETGTGKELVARCLHQQSPRAVGPFVAINCAAIPAALLESEFFGYEKGAFSGATTAHPGRLESASGGTLLLDEIGDMPMDLQAKLLRVLEQRSFERVGGVRALPLECRILAATHRDLPTAIAQGTFREDLYYRLNVIPLHLAPLREHKEDIAALFGDARVRSELLHGTSFELDADARALLEEHDWPGNVRELMNLVDRLAILFAGRTVTADDLRVHLRQRRAEIGEIPSAAPLVAGQPARMAESGVPHLELRVALAALERRLIEQAMAAAGGVVAQAAELLHIPRTTLIQKLRKLRAAADADKSGH
jgi:sigma-54 specific flagellar transcriptional regulator A